MKGYKVPQPRVEFWLNFQDDILTIIINNHILWVGYTDDYLFSSWRFSESIEDGALYRITDGITTSAA